MRAVVVAGSEQSGRMDPQEFASADMVVAVDAGAEAIAKMGLTPSLLVGDMDSVSEDTREYLRGQGVEFALLPTAKDETDLEAALRILVQRGADEIVVYGALGGPRLDHLLGNVMLLSSPWLAGVDVRLAVGKHEVFLARGEAALHGRPGDLVTLLPLTDKVQGVHTEGLRYPLKGETLLRSSTRSLSNEMTGALARVTHDEGDLLVVQYRGRLR